MTRRQQIAWLAAGVLLVAMIVGWMQWNSPIARLERALVQFGFTETTANEAEARRALEMVGTNAVPYLLRWIDTHSHEKDFAVRLRNFASDWGVDSLTLDQWAFRHNARAMACVWAFSALGTNAAFAHPDLKRIAQRPDAWAAKEACFWIEANSERKNRR